MGGSPALRRRLVGAAVVAVAALGAARECCAVLVPIEYYDRGAVNPEFSGGPLWTGFVDTTANTLTIQRWQELPLHGNEFWIPRSLPQVWPARDSTGSLFDVPDTFDGRIGDYAFISQVTLRDMSWRQPIFDYSTSPPTLLGTPNATFLLDTGDVYPGWGGYALQESGPGDTIVLSFKTSNISPGQPDFDEHVMPALPVSAIAYNWSTNATITTPMSTLLPAAVPEATAWMCVGAALLVAAPAFWRRRVATVAATRALGDC